MTKVKISSEKNQTENFWAMKRKAFTLSRVCAGSLVLLSSLASAQAYFLAGHPYLYRLVANKEPANREPTHAFYKWDYLIVGNNGDDSRPSRFAWGTGAPKQKWLGFATAKEVTDNGQAVWLEHLVFEPSRLVGSTVVPQRAYYVVLEFKKPNEDIGRCLMSDTNGDISIPNLERKPGAVQSRRAIWQDQVSAFHDPNATICGWTADEMLSNKRGLWSIIHETIESYATSRCLIFSNNGKDVAASLYRWPGSGVYCGFTARNDLGDIGQGLFQSVDTIILPYL